jgi:hypothetical protein
VAIRRRHPFVGKAEDVADIIDDVTREIEGSRGPITPGIAVRIRTYLRRRGHDGIIVRDGGGDGIDYVIDLENSSVKVIVP